jgi:hypothetical protein
MQELKGNPRNEFEGLNEVDPNEVKKGKQKLLIQVKTKKRGPSSLVQGGKNLGYSEIDLLPQVELSARSLSSSGVYVLDAGTKIYHFCGSKTSRVARAKGFELANRINVKERYRKAECILIGPILTPHAHTHSLSGSACSIMYVYLYFLTLLQSKARRTISNSGIFSAGKSKSRTPPRKSRWSHASTGASPPQP